MKVEVWAYCLMPNHMHLIATPQSEEGLRRTIGETHRRYTRQINFREGWRGHLWQGRFASFPMDESYLLAATRYVELNPVRAKLVDRPEVYKWSSAVAHLEGRDDELVKVSLLLGLVGNWREFLSQAAPEHQREELRRHERTGDRSGLKDLWPSLRKHWAVFFIVKNQGLREKHRIKYGVPRIRMPSIRLTPRQHRRRCTKTAVDGILFGALFCHTNSGLVESEWGRSRSSPKKG